MKKQCISTCFPREIRDQSDGISALEINSREVPEMDERRLIISFFQFISFAYAHDILQKF